MDSLPDRGTPLLPLLPLGALTPDAAPVANALPAGTLLDEFEIIRVLGAGGFGIVYLALDTALLRYVAIKEFMPTALAGRVAGGAVEVHTESAAKSFELGLDSFFNEGRMLARFDHPSLVKVFRFWKARGTAYMAMQYYPGQTLKEVRQAMSVPPDEAWLRALVDPMLDALAVLHAEGVYHRDIAPDNVLMLPDGRPVILDFGSARRVLGDQTQSLTAILKPNFSPVEQYADEGTMRQGGYTDLYALGGTVYFMLTGRAPIPSAMRAVRDSLPLLAGPSAARHPLVSGSFLEAVDWSLAVDPEMRPQTVAAMRGALDGLSKPPPPTTRHGSAPAPCEDFESDTLLATTQSHAPTGQVRFERTMRAPRPAPASSTAPLASALPGRRRLPLTAAVAIVASLLGGIAWTVMASGRVAPPPVAAATAAAAVIIPSAAPVAAPATIDAPAAAPAAVAAPAATSAPASVIPSTERRGSAVASRAPARHGTLTVSESSQAREPARSSPSPATPVVVSVPKAVPAELCAGVNFFARVACLSRSCGKPENASLPQCMDIRRADEERQRRAP